MSEWYRYGLGPDQYATVTYDALPSADDLDLLIEFLRLHRRGLTRGRSATAHDDDQQGPPPPDPR